MLNSRQLWVRTVFGVALFFGLIRSSLAADRQFLQGHVPPVVARLQPVGRLPGTNSLNLAIGLPLRNTAELEELLRQLYDPASTNFHKFLLPAEFAARFGPTEEDYLAVQNFARSNGLVVTGTYGNRVVLDLRGRVTNVEQAFQVNLQTYRHPSEARIFFAPDTEPSLPANLRVTSIEGLSDYSRPRPAGRRVKAPKVRPLSFNGTGPGHQYAGSDFRNAYVPGTALTGAGQTVALLEYSDYFLVDITNYENIVGATVGTTNYVPLTNVVVGGTTPGTNNNDEVALDIEMAISMAPKLSQVIVYEDNSVSSSLLNRIATDNLAKQVSSSWLVGPWSSSTAATYDTILTNMAAQGQSYFQSSGDGDAYTGDQPLDSGTTVPADSPYATIVGGTTLTMNGYGVSWFSDAVWNYNLNPNNPIPNEGSGGGISSHYPIPYWQTNVSMAGNGGSTTYRNIPDVALTADNVFVSYDNGDDSGTYYFMGTSCAAPLWAGFCALVNQQSTASNPTNFVGFLNPALYAIGTSAGYSNCFHDITTGNNIGTNTPGLFYATNGYDLCTGWGTPMGQSLINALAGPTDALIITPSSGFNAYGAIGGPFTVTAQTFLLTNSGAASLNWQIASTSSWLNVSSTSGTLAVAGQTSVTVSLNSAASNLLAGTYSANVWFTNLNSQVAQSRQFTLLVGPLVPNGGFETGDFTSWTLTGDTRYILVADASDTPNPPDILPHSGNYCAELGTYHDFVYLSQTLPTITGQPYLLSFWLNSPDGLTVNQFFVTWNGNTNFNQVNLPAIGWTNMQFIVTATGTSSILQFGFRDDQTWLGLDDVSVQLVPVPLFQPVTETNGTLNFTWNALTGLVYQVQYKTNLLQTNWINLGNAITATNVTATATNLIGSDPQRFYRLQLLY